MIRNNGSSCIGQPFIEQIGSQLTKANLTASTNDHLPAPTGPTKYNTCLASSPFIDAE